MDSCCGFRAVAVREKYPGLTLLALANNMWNPRNLVKISAGNGLLPDVTMPSAPMMINPLRANFSERK